MLSSRSKLMLAMIYSFGLLAILLYLPWTVHLPDSMRNDGFNWLWAMRGSIMASNWGAAATADLTYTPDFRFLFLEILSWSVSMAFVGLLLSLVTRRKTLRTPAAREAIH